MEPEIKFKTLTDGLGFHPFEDGLPYAPTKKGFTTGTGAVSAGKPQFAFPPAPQPQFRSSSIDAPAEKIRKELESIQNQRLEQARVMAARKHVPLEIHYGFSYSLIRVFAYLLDSAFNLSICASILSTALISTEIDTINNLNDPAIITIGVFLFICNWALLSAQEIAFGTTIGKKIFGLKLDGTGVQCLVRAVLFIPSLLFGGLGIFISVFDSKKRCWHDRLTQIQPT